MISKYLEENKSEEIKNWRNFFNKIQGQILDIFEVIPKKTM